MTTPAPFDAALRLCRRRTLRLTEPRRRVLAIVAGSSKPLTAYGILRRMGRDARPPTVYRALEFFLSNGIMHKIQSRAAFVACARPGQDGGCCILLCTACGRCDESCGRRPRDSLRRAAGAAGFLPSAMIMDILGLCRRCRKKKP